MLSGAALCYCGKKCTGLSFNSTYPQQDSVTSVAVHAHDIVAGSVDGSVRRFDIRMGRAYSDDLHHPITSIALSHDGQCVLAACLDSTLR